MTTDEEFLQTRYKAFQVITQWDGIKPLQEIYNPKLAVDRVPLTIPRELVEKYTNIYTRQDLLRVLQAFLDGHTDAWDLFQWAEILDDADCVYPEDTTTGLTKNTLICAMDSIDKERAEELIHYLKTDRIEAPQKF